jgi:hypothetical protein
MTEALPQFQKALKGAKPREVSVGYRTVKLFPMSDLDEQQVGYSRDPEGHNLTGSGEGDWRKSWLVFAYEDTCGDPIFVDLSEPCFPVYTAAHGQGRWDPTLIAGSFDGFVAGMAAVKRLAKGRSTPVALEPNPLLATDRSRLKQELTCLGADADTEFWTSWFEA